MVEFTMQLNHPLTEEEWNTLTDAELEHSKEIEFTTPSGKKVLFQKMNRGKWIPQWTEEWRAVPMGYACSLCGESVFMGLKPLNYCPNCGARMDLTDE